MSGSEPNCDSTRQPIKATMELPRLPSIVMSHPFPGQQYQESLTTPSTPQYPTWETLDNMTQPVEQHEHEDTQQQQHHQQAHGIDFPDILASVPHQIEIPEQFLTTSPLHHNTIQLPPAQQPRSDGAPSPADFTSEHYGDNATSMRASTSTGPVGPTARSSGRQPLRQSPANPTANPTRMHPYRRPQSAASITGPSTSSSSTHPRAVVTRSPQVTTPIISIPASAMSTPPSSADPRVLNFSSAPSGKTPYTSPSSMNPPPLPMTPSEAVMPHYLPPQHPPPQHPVPQYPQHPPTQQSRPQYQYPPIPPQPPSRQPNQPRLQVQTQITPPAQAPAIPARRQRFVPRSDVQYDPRTNVLTACLEMPGVRKDDLRVTLSTCLFNRVKQVVIQGLSQPVFPPATAQSQQGFSGASALSAHTSATPAVGVGHGAGTVPGGLAAPHERIEAANFSIRERKYGEFSRTFPVPSDTKPEDVQAVMEDGILTVRVACGIPALNSETYIIPIR
ncbi:hypothetical protein D9758_003726 [Tetrapyrgos nigripes]|uniref:SHSP domain-containing protein n=1 Tax=Tetrapyrgos nigripes TaxID=182062 RepID=A0A8H5GMH8_9AGAR|nr:hypothetical protein D9758_003726 [Tetrapyrgos nigripes]